jgi:CheY-like chemotaxis protein
MAYKVLSLPDATGRPIAFATASQDVTERKRMEDNLRRLAADLSEADRRKNEFLATLAHELRNPLAPIPMPRGRSGWAAATKKRFDPRAKCWIVRSARWPASWTTCSTSDCREMNGYEACRRIREQPWGQDMLRCVFLELFFWGSDLRSDRIAVQIFLRAHQKVLDLVMTLT